MSDENAGGKAKDGITKTVHLEKFRELRQKAREKIGDDLTGVEPESLSMEDLRKIIEDLKIYQIELEMQNEELFETQARLQDSTEKYSDLYDFAPVGYLTLTPEGKIRESNLTAANMMGANRTDMTSASVYGFFAKEDRDILFVHLRKLFKEKIPQSCEIRLISPSHPKAQRYVKIDSVPDFESKEFPVSKTTMTDITERKKTESALFRSESQLRLLSTKLLETQEQEREQIAYDLHDDICQLLVAGKLNAQNILYRIPDHNSHEYKALANLIDINQQTVSQIKRIVSKLRPTVLDGLGIIAAIEWLCKEYRKIDPELAVTVKTELNESDIPKPIKSVIFRILQEVMANISQHSHADHVEIYLHNSGGILEFTVKDNGKGFDLGDVLFFGNLSRGVGITSMTERARMSGGCLEIHSSKTNGTTVNVRWPGNMPAQIGQSCSVDREVGIVRK